MAFNRVTRWGGAASISPGVATGNTSEARLRLALRRLCTWLLVGLALGMACAAFQWHSRCTMALLWALAVFATAFLIGFLFGIPRVLQNTDDSSGVPNGARLRVNTNLEQVSDWLVKILVGLGLTELKGLGGHIYRMAGYVAPSLYKEQTKSLSAAQVNAAGALVVYFAVLGFLTGYLITRLLLGTLFRDADERTISPVEEMKILRGSSLPVEPTQGMKLDLDPKALYAAKKLEKLSLDEALRQGIQPEALAVAKLCAGEYGAALEAYAAAIARAPKDLQLLINYALALYQAGKPAADVVAELENARQLLPASSTELHWQVYRYLTFFSLYLAPPDSFTRTIKYASEYTSDPSNRPSAAVYLNLACAYGQQVKYGAASIDSVRTRALDALKRALQIGSSNYRARIEQLLFPSAAQKQQGEDDLEVFAQDAEFVALVRAGSAPISTEPVK